MGKQTSRSGRAPATVVAKAAKTSSTGLDQLGVTGLTRYGTRGSVYEEFLPELEPTRARRIYREMRDNDPIISAMLFAIEALLRNVTWHVEGGEDEHREFVESCIHDMSHTWEDFIAEVLSMLTFGYSFHEVVYKRRQGGSRDPSKRSKFNDGKIGWRKLPIRAQDSLWEWVFDEDGGVQSFVQQAPPEYRRIEIPLSRGLLFRTTSHKNNPEGRSVLRGAYRPWFFKKRIEEIEGIGVERDLAGLPVIYRTKEIADTYDADLKKILRNVRRDEQEGLLLPMARDEAGNLELEFKLLNSGGTRQFNTTQIIDRYNRNIAMTILADFILLGSQGVGSFALASSKTRLFATALGAFMKQISAVMNRFAIPRLLAVNGMTVKEYPKLVTGDIDTPDLDELGNFVMKLAGAGATLFPDEDLENYLREAAHLPKKSEKAMQEQQWFQDTAAQYLGDKARKPWADEPVPEGAPKPDGKASKPKPPEKPE